MVEVDNVQRQRQILETRRRSSVIAPEDAQPKKNYAIYIIWFLLLSFLTTGSLILMFDHHLSPETTKYTRVVKSVGKVLMLESFGAYIFNKHSGNLAVVDMLRDSDYIDHDSLHQFQDGLFSLADNRKTEVLDNLILDSQPITAVELGTFVGYQSIRLARNLPENGHLITCESDRMTYAISNALIHFAGLQDKITLYFGDSHHLLRKLHLEGKKVDFMLVDHLQKPHLEDFILAEKLKILSDEAVIVGTNSKRQHDGEFSYFMDAHPSYDTRRHDISMGMPSMFDKSTIKSLTHTARDNFDVHIKFDNSEELTVSRRKLQDWGPYRSTPDMNHNPGYEEIVEGHYVFYPDRMIFMNELGRTPEYQDYVDSLMNRQYHKSKKTEKIRERARRMFRGIETTEAEDEQKDDEKVDEQEEVEERESEHRWTEDDIMDQFMAIRDAFYDAGSDHDDDHYDFGYDDDDRWYDHDDYHHESETVHQENVHDDSGAFYYDSNGFDANDDADYEAYYVNNLQAKAVHNSNVNTKNSSKVVVDGKAKKVDEEKCAKDNFAHKHGAEKTVKNHVVMAEDKRKIARNVTKSAQEIEYDDEDDWIFSERTSHDSKKSKKHFKVATKKLFDREETISN